MGLMGSIEAFKGTPLQAESGVPSGLGLHCASGGKPYACREGVPCSQDRYESLSGSASVAHLCSYPLLQTQSHSTCHKTPDLLCRCACVACMAAACQKQAARTCSGSLRHAPQHSLSAWAQLACMAVVCGPWEDRTDSVSSCGHASAAGGGAAWLEGFQRESASAVQQTTGRNTLKGYCTKVRNLHHQHSSMAHLLSYGLPH